MAMNMQRSASEATFQVKRSGSSRRLDAWDSALLLDVPESLTDAPAGPIRSDYVLCRICERNISARRMARRRSSTSSLMSVPEFLSTGYRVRRVSRVSPV